MNIKEDTNILHVNEYGDIDSIMRSKWCTSCYPKRETAFYTYKGNSLCEECFEKELNPTTPVDSKQTAKEHDDKIREEAKMELEVEIGLKTFGLLMAEKEKIKKEAVREYCNNLVKKTRHKWKNEYKCVVCGDPFIVTRTLCLKHQKMQAEKQKRWAKLKAQQSLSGDTK